MKKLLDRIFIDGLGGMAQGLFATLIIGTIIQQIGLFMGGGTGDLIYELGKIAAGLTGAGIGVGVARKLEAGHLVIVSAAVVGMIGAFAGKILSGQVLVDGNLVLAGPGLYFFLKKTGKRQYLWGAICACSAVFVMLISLFGQSTRLKAPVLTYVREIWQYDTYQKDYINFCAQAPYNASYELYLDPSYDLVTYNRMDYMSNSTKRRMRNMKRRRSVSENRKTGQKFPIRLHLP